MISLSSVFPAAPADPTSSALVIRAYDSDVEGDDLMFSKDWAWTDLPDQRYAGAGWRGVPGQGGARAAAMNVAAELAKLDYVELFLRTGTAQMDRLWTAANGPRDLEALAVDPNAAWQPRFLAAEILFRKLPGFPSGEQKQALAVAYVETLRAASIGNPWGLPGELDGPAGQHLVSLGEVASSGLIALLDDGRRVPYWGSQEAMLGNSYTFRVKDFAAFFLSRIRGVPYVLHTDPAARDGAIQALRNPLGRV